VLCKRQGIEWVVEQVLAYQLLLLIVRFLTLLVEELMEGISTAATVLLVLLKVYIIPCNYRGHINVMLVLQSRTDCLQVMAGLSTDTFPAASDVTYDIGLIKIDENIEIKQEGEVNVKPEKVVSSEEEQGIDIKEEGGIYSEGEQEEEEKIDIQEEEDADLKEEVS
jgi:hypothetical protein